jgi:RNA polymerase sigma factor (sigma-70 family)
LFSNGGVPDEKGLRRLYDSVAPLLLRIAWRITGSSEAAEDIVHDAFVRLVERKLPFPSLDDAKYWLIRVAKNFALNYAKRKGREAKAYERWWRGERESTGTAEDEVVRDEDSASLRKALDSLPDNLKYVLVLKEYGGLSYKEIGRVLGISEGNVKVRAFRAREALLARFEEGRAHVS